MLNSHRIFVFEYVTDLEVTVKNSCVLQGCIQETGCCKLLCISGDYILSKETENWWTAANNLLSAKLKPKLLFWHEVRKKGLTGNVCLIQTHWQLLWYFYFRLWIQSIILFSLAVKILTSIDNSWLGLHYQNLSRSPLNSSSCISFKRKLPADRLTTPICSKSDYFIIRRLNYVFLTCYADFYYNLYTFQEV